MNSRLAAGEARDSGGAREVPWSLGLTVWAFVMIAVVWIVGSEVLLALTHGLYDTTTCNRTGRACDQLAVGIYGYQFLALGTLIAGAWIVYSRGRRRWSLLGFRYPGWSVLLKTVAVIPLLFIGVIVIYWAFTTFLPAFHLQGNAKDTLQGPHEHLGQGERIFALVWASVQAPLVEETVFRGILFQGLRQFFLRRVGFNWAAGAAAVGSGVVFGLVHFEPHTLPVLIFLGIVLAYIFQRAGSIYASMLVHAVFNFVGVVTVLF